MGESMRIVSIGSIVRSLGKILDYSEKEVEDLIKKYAIMSDQDVITELCKLVHEQFYVNTNEPELYDYFLDTINNINPDISQGLDHMKKELLKEEKENKLDEDALDKNHQLINELLDYFTLSFNQNDIDYYVAGTLSAFIIKLIPLYKTFDSIELLVNEKDLERVGELINESGFTFYDDRFISLDRYHELENKPNPSLIGASNADGSFHLKIRTFRREEDKSMTTLDYLHIPQENGVRVDVIERSTTPYTKYYQYSERPVYYSESTFKTVTAESVFDGLSTKKDEESKHDCKLLESHLDLEVLKSLRQNVNHKTVLKDVKKDEMKL